MKNKTKEAAIAIKAASYVQTPKESMAKFVSSTYLGPSFLKKRFKPGISKVYYSLAVYGDEEKMAIKKALDEGWLGLGKYSNKFSDEIAKIVGKKSGVFVNSGSSGTLLALRALNLPKNSEVITAACTFATTLSAILNNNLIPVFADSELRTYNLNLKYLPKMVSKKTRALILPHTLGNLNDMKVIRSFCKRHNLFFIEDSCDTLGGKFDGKPTGYYSDMTVCSFYASHHITTGGSGGMICVDDNNLKANLQANRDWGRFGDDDEDINERFNYHIDGIPYDRKFIYSYAGFNMKPTEIQAAFGLEQLKKLQEFNRIRKRNYVRLRKSLEKLNNFFILPQELPKAEVYWLAFPITIRDGMPFSRLDILRFLESNNIQTRLLFAGNILRQPAFKDMPKRVVGKLDNADKIMRDTFVIGCHQGLTDEMVDYICGIIRNFLRPYTKNR